MTKFTKIPFPFVDFAVISFESDTHAIRALKSLDASGLLEGFNLEAGASLGQQGTVVILPNDRQLLPYRDGSFAFSGTALHNGKLLIGDKDAKSLIVDGPDTKTGQFSYFIIERDKGVKVGFDVFGHGQIFLSQHKEFAIASNRLHLHTIVMKALGENPEPDAVSAASMFLSEKTIFSHQQCISDMCVKGVRLMRLDERAHLKRGKLFPSKHNAIERIFNPTRPYKALLEEGVEELIAHSRAVIGDGRFEKIVCDLSGGKDSRMVLGAVMRHPSWKDRIRIHSMDVKTNNDLDIACGIANLFDLNFDDGSPVQTIPTTIEENISLWRSYFHGMYHRMGAGAWSHKGANLSTITLSGGSGGLLRGLWSQMLGIIDKGQSIEQLCLSLAGNGAHQGAGSVYQEAAHRFAAEVASLPVDGSLEKLDLHYFYHRNRSHFGMRCFSFFHQNLTVFPLLSTSLISAAWALPLAERRRYKATLDVLHAVHPVLPYLPFDGGQPIVTPDMPPPVVNLDTRRDSWEAANERRTKAIKQNRTLPDGMKWAEWPTAIADRATAAWNDVPILQKLISPEEMAKTKSGIMSGNRDSFAMASRMMAIQDAT